MFDLKKIIYGCESWWGFIRAKKIGKSEESEMVEKIYRNKYMATCDNCGTGQECDSWADVMEFMREEGWKKKLFDGEWKHYCSECVEVKE